MWPSNHSLPLKSVWIRLFTLTSLLAATSWCGADPMPPAPPKAYLVPQKGHPTEAESLTFSPDGTLLASIDGDGPVRLWSTRTGELLATLTGLPVKPCGVAFSPDGKTLACGFESGVVRLWNVPSGSLRRELALGRPTDGFPLAYSPRGDRLAFGTHVWEPRSGRKLGVHPSPNAWLAALAYSPDGMLLAGLASDQTLHIWDAATLKRLRILHESQHRGSLAFASATVLTAAGDTSTSAWDVRTGKKLSELRGASKADSENAVLPLAAAGAVVTITSVYGNLPYRLRVWKPGQRSQARALPVEIGSWAVAVTRSGRWVAFVGESGIEIRDTHNGKLVRSLAAGPPAPRVAAYSPDGASLAVAEGNRIRLWDLRRGVLARTLKGYGLQVAALAFGPNGQLVSGGGQFPEDYGPSGEILVWDTTSGKVTRWIRGRMGHVTSVALSPDGTRVAAVDVAGTAGVWSTRSPQRLWKKKVHEAGGKQVAFSPGGKWIATVGSATAGKGTPEMRLWSASTGEESLAISPEMTSVVGTHPGGLLYTGRGHSRVLEALRFTQPETGDPDEVTFAGTHAYEGAAPVHASADGRWAIGTKADGSYALVKLAESSRVISFRPEVPLHSLALSPDGARVAAVGRDGAVRLWDAATGRVVLTLETLPGSEWVARTPVGYYTASAGAHRHLRWRVHTPGSRPVLKPAAAYASVFQRPERVAQALRSGAAEEGRPRKQ